MTQDAEDQHRTPIASDRARAELARRFARQAESAVARTSPLYERLLTACVEDITRRGAVWDLVASRAHEAAGRALPLRLMAAVHRVVLDGRAPQLDAFYPSRGGHPSAGVWPAFLSVLSAQAAVLDELMDRPLQTNEVGRSKAVVAALGWLARRTPHPIRVWEIGASAGLNLNWPHYDYDADAGKASGSHRSRVCLPVPAGVAVDELRGRVREVVGCDREPIGVHDADGVQWLRACVWADQLARLDLLDAALAVAEESPPAVEAAEASAWLQHRLATAPDDDLIVITQSVLDQYLTGTERAAIASAIGDAAERRRPGSLARVTVEPPPARDATAVQHRGLAAVRVSLWPDDRDVLLGHIDFHGRTLTLDDTYWLD